jgi:hypothetical protein
MKDRQAFVDALEGFAFQGSPVFIELENAVEYIQNIYLHDLRTFHDLLGHIQATLNDTLSKHPKPGFWTKQPKCLPSSLNHRKLSVRVVDGFAWGKSLYFYKFENAIRQMQKIYLHNLGEFYDLLKHIQAVYYDTIKKHPKPGFWAQWRIEKSF